MTRLLDKQYEGMDITALADAPVEALAGVTAGDAAALKQAFNVTTIGDLGRNRNIVAAVAIAALAGNRNVSDQQKVSHTLGVSDDELIRRYINTGEQDSDQAEARLVDSGVHVWALVGYGPLVNWDANTIASDYALSLGEVQAALAYYRRHRDVIEARIAANAIPVT